MNERRNHIPTSRLRRIRGILAAVLVGASLLVACAEKEGAAPPPPEPASGIGSGNGDTDLPDTNLPDTGTDVPRPVDATYADLGSTTDTAVGNVIRLEGKSPPDAAADTAAPDVLTFVDAALPGLGDAPGPGP